MSLYSNNIANQIIESSKTQSTNIINTARANGISLLFSTLNITDPYQKNNLINGMALYDNNNATVMHNIKINPLVNF